MIRIIRTQKTDAGDAGEYLDYINGNEAHNAATEMLGRDVSKTLIVKNGERVNLKLPFTLTNIERQLRKA